MLQLVDLARCVSF
ncbi:hypothetical protein H0O68_22725 [Escherichia coli]|nr:hypothetical protein [Escherichia coli]